VFFYSTQKEVIALAYQITDKCINCGACEPVCPVEAISEKGNVRAIDPGTCIDCGACVETCPADAIQPG
jgi:ferredoxin